ncbi:MAG: PEPxxWA-CTERM sorting domain-containing protein [Thermaurantiacus sp.]
MRRFAPALAAVAALAVAAPAAAAELVVDTGLRIQTMSFTGGEFGQSFLAPGAELLTIGVQFATLNPAAAQNSVTVRLREGEGLGGAILRAITLTPVNTGRDGPFVFTDFDFSGILLDPGVAYTLTLVNNGGGARNGIVFGPNLINPPFGQEFGPDPYPDGRLIFAAGFNPCGGAQVPQCDLNFRVATADVITAIPEPATWAMLIMGFGLVGSAIRGRRTAAA